MAKAKSARKLSNAEIALHFDELGDLYELDGAIVHRVVAYRNAAKAIRESTTSVAELANAGRAQELPGIGKTIAEKIDTLLETGSIASAEKLNGDTAFEEIFSEAKGRIVVAAFASSIDRLQIVLDVAQQFDRHVCVLGRSMQKNVEVADRLGYLDIPDGLMVSLNQAKLMSDDEIVSLVTGSQGESRAALSQMATQSYKGLMIEEGDTVVFSARIIPGNERLISRMIGFIYKRGANIIEEKRRLVHVSGHASQEDIRIMTEAVVRSLWYRFTVSIECFSGTRSLSKTTSGIRRTTLS